MRASARCGAIGTVAAIGCLLALAPARAQDVRVTAPAPDSAELKPLTSEESDVLGRALLFDPASVGSGKTRALRRPSLAKAGKLDVNRSDNPDGSSKVAVKHPLPADLDASALDANVGADLNLAAPPESVYQPGRPLPNAANAGTGSGAAWASVGLDNLASVNARVDPTNDQGKIGGTLKRSVPVGKDLSVTLEDSYSLTETFSQPAATSSLALATPAAGTPPAGSLPAATAPTQVFDNSKSLKFNIAPTGTTFGAGVTTASNDPVSHNTLSADQKLFGPLHVTTSVTDVGQPTVNKSITAGFKLDW